MMVEIRYLKGGRIAREAAGHWKDTSSNQDKENYHDRPKPLPEDGTCNSSHIWHKSWSCVRHRACSRRTQSYLRLQGVHA